MGNGRRPIIDTAKDFVGLGGGLAMIKSKGCPKCRGAFYLFGDQYGKYFTCMQCGCHRDVVETEVGANAGLKIKSALAERLKKGMEVA